MTFLRSRRVWTRQPQRSRPIGLVFSDRLLVAVTPADHSNIATGGHVTAEPALAPVSDSVAFNTSISTISIPSVSFTSASSMTALIVVRNLQMSGTNHGIWREGSASSGTSFFIIRGSDKRPWIRWAGGDILSPGASGAVFATGSDYNIIYRINPSYSDVWWAGAKQYRGSGASAATGSIVNIGYQSSTDQKVGQIALAVFWGRTLLDADCAKLSLNPWLVMEP